MKKQKDHQFSVDIVIPNWNGKHLLEKNLPKVIAYAKDAGIIVADDASVDGSVEWLRKTYPQVQIVAGTSQRGFAGNVNAGVEASRATIVVLLNTDVTPKHNFLHPLLEHFRDKSICAVGCLEESVEQDGIVLRGRGEARWEKGYFVHNRGQVDKKDTAWVSGGSGAFRKETWDMLGGMDTLFNPFYWEDIDLSYRAQKAGFRVVFEPKSVVIHRHMEGKIKTSYTPAQVKQIVYRNQYIFMWKNMSDSHVVFAHMLWVPVRLFQALIHKDWNHLAGFFDAVMLLPKIAQRRAQNSLHWMVTDSDVVTSRAV